MVRCLVLLLLLSACVSCREGDDEDAAAPTAFQRQELDTAWLPVKKGPWGTLEYRRFFLPLPDVWRNTSPGARPTIWHVPKLTPEKINELILSGPLTEVEQNLWKETCRVELAENGSTIHPSSEFRWELRPQSRALLYGWLGRFPQNQAQAWAFCYDADNQDEWFSACALRPELKDALRHLLYHNGSMVCFADLDLLEEYLAGPEERSELVAVLHRQPYCELRLRLDPKTDLAGLSAYWGEGNRTQRVKKIFKQTLQNQTEPYLSVAQVIPSLPRTLLNTYPAVPSGEDKTPPNCSWTVLNFFNRIPDSRFTDWTLFKDTLTKHHDRVTRSPHYGDIVVIEDSKGQPMHAALYLAGDFVYTKNGGHLSRPWVIMRLRDMAGAYSLSGPTRIVYYRWNPSKTRTST